MNKKVIPKISTCVNIIIEKKLSNCINKKKFIKEVWYKNCKYHRDCVNSETGLTLHAYIGIYIGGFTFLMWYKDGVKNRNDIDPKTGLTLPTKLFYYGKYNDKYDINSRSFFLKTVEKKWYKNGKLHRDDIDPKTGFLLPAKNGNFFKNRICWYKNGVKHHNEIDPETGITLPAFIDDNRTQLWYKDGKLNNDDIDNKTGLTFPAEIYANNSKGWYKVGERHRDDKDPDTGIILPALYIDGKKWFFQRGIQIYTIT